MAMVLSPRNQARLDAAAGPALESIRRDRKLAPRELKPLFGYIERHLFDADFSVEAMKRECGIRDNSVSTRFRRRTDLRPRDYVREHRLQVAWELLKYEEPNVVLVAEMLGFSSAQVLSRNFTRRFEVRPRDHRKAHAGAGAGTKVPDFTVIELRRGLEGLLEPGRGRALVQELSAFYSPEGEPVAPDVDFAAAVWEQIRRLPPEDELPVMREQLATACRELFELLCERSRVEGRRSRQRGVRLAERALECLDVCASVLGDELPGLKALGWARLGRARRFALDFPAAEAAFRQSAFELSIPNAGRDPGIEGEILFLKSGFRAIQHRFPEAKDLASRALKLLEPDRQPQVLAETLILCATIADAEGNFEESIADLTRAMELVDMRDGRLRLTLSHNLATAYMIAGHFAEADELLPLARELCAAHGETLERCQLRLLEGRVAQGLGRTALAEDYFFAAHAGFSAAGETGHAALAAVELALIYCQQVRPEATRYAVEAIPLLDAFQIRSEALAARRLLAEAVVHERLTPEILRQVRAVLGDLTRDPSVHLPRRSPASGSPFPRAY